MKERIIKFKIQSWKDRESIVTALASSGYSVHIEEKREHSYTTSPDYYVVVRLK